MSCGSKVGKSRSGNLISMIYSRDLAVVLLLSALLVLTFFMREAAVRHVLAQLEERSSVAVHHLAVEAENRWAAGLEAGEQVWWGEVLERILLADDMLVGLRVLDDGGEVVTQSRARARRGTVSFVTDLRPGLTVQVVMDAQALAKVKVEYARFLIPEGMLLVLFILIRLLQGKFLHPSRSPVLKQREGSSNGGESQKTGKFWRRREQEKELVAKELNEGLSQSLSAVMIQMGMLPSASKGKDGSVGEMRQVLEESITAMNFLARRLWPNVLRDLGLQPALNSLVRDFQANTGMMIDLQLEQRAGGFEQIPLDIGLLAYRLIENILEYMAEQVGASQVILTVCVCPAELWLELEGDGDEFEAESMAQGLGAEEELIELQDVLTSFNGEIRVDFQRGKGVLVTASIPIDNLHGGAVSSDGQYSCAVGG